MRNLSEEVESVLHRYVDFNGKDHALGKIYTPGFNYLEKFWYLGSDMQRVYLDPEQLVEVDYVHKRLDKPRMVIHSHIRNPHIKRYIATLDITGKDYSVSGFFIERRKVERHIRAQLAIKTRNSFKDLNGWIKRNPSTFNISLTNNC